MSEKRRDLSMDDLRKIEKTVSKDTFRKFKCLEEDNYKINHEKVI
jgi:hypothetical protein